jgi:transketolase
VLSRQNLPQWPRSAEQRAGILRGAYVLRDAVDPQLILMGSGSEVALAMAAAELLAAQGRRVRVVSMPSAQVFAEQPVEYQHSVLPTGVTCRIAIEAGVADLWVRWVGPKGRVIGMIRYGESAPAKILFEHFGFTPENVVNVATAMLD